MGALQNAHDCQNHFIFPPRGGDLDADRQSLGADQRFLSAALSDVPSGSVGEGFVGPDSRPRHHAGWQSQQIGMEGVAGCRQQVDGGLMRQRRQGVGRGKHRLDALPHEDFLVEAANHIAELLAQLPELGRTPRPGRSAL